MALQESDIKFGDIPIHIWEDGEGYPILMLHGSGAGAELEAVTAEAEGMVEAGSRR